jgi:8-oxo-dGTP pyrophosphatase MutT (NUDIX family)
MKIQKSAGIILYFLKENSKNNKKEKEPFFLLLKYKTYWGFPKGLIEEDEKPEETAIRETKEETNISNIKIKEDFKHIQSWFFKADNDFIKKEAVFFLGETTEQESKNTKISFEHEDFLWLGYKGALKKLKIKNNKEMLEKAYEFIRKQQEQTKINEF